MGLTINSWMHNRVVRNTNHPHKQASSLTGAALRGQPRRLVEHKHVVVAVNHHRVDHPPLAIGQGRPRCRRLPRRVINTDRIGGLWKRVGVCVGRSASPPPSP